MATVYEKNPKFYAKLFSPSGRYHVQCVTSWLGNSIVWWAPKRNGYTSRIDEAGIYEEAEARQIEELRGEEWAIPVEIGTAAATRHVVGGDLDKAIAAFREIGGG